MRPYYNYNQNHDIIAPTITQWEKYDDLYTNSDYQSDSWYKSATQAYAEYKEYY